MECPKCNSQMVLRSNKTSGDLFWSCSKYPICKETARYVDEEAIEALSKGFKPTEEQTNIFEAVKLHHGNLVVNAVAGSGKTSTMLQALNFLPTNQKSVFLAFNKSISDELSRRAPGHVEVRTIHSLGFRFIRERFPGIEIDADKSDRLLKTRMSESDYKRSGSLTAKVYSLLLNNMVSPERNFLEDILDYYGIECFDIDELYHNLRDLYFDCMDEFRKGKTVSFDEMIFYPAMEKQLCSHYDNIFVDECQDLNKAQMQFVLNCAHPTTMIVAVGDRNQSIYGFRGADTNAIDYMKEALNAKELPLTTCFRCPVSHLKLAQKYVPQIKPREGAPEGTIQRILMSTLLTTVAKEDLVLCRVNAPLLPIAFDLIVRGKPAYVKGRDIGGSIVTLLDKHKTKRPDIAIERIVDDANNKAQKLLSKGKESAASLALDVANCAVFFLSHAQTVEDAVSEVYNIFADYGPGIVLSSIHKAKGLEASRVVIIGLNAMPFKAQMDWERQQEQNLAYVALTRSKDTLLHVDI